MTSTYAQLLTYGYNNLYRLDVDNLDTEENITGIEESLFDEPKFYAQILELNRYVYTTASTNYPTNPDFQAMFVSGYMLKSQGEKLKPILRSRGIGFQFSDQLSTGLEKTLFMPTNAYDIGLIYVCLGNFPTILESIFGQDMKDIATSDVIYTYLSPENLEYLKRRLVTESYQNPNSQFARLASETLKTGGFLIPETTLVDNEVFAELPEFAKPIQDQLIQFDIEDVMHPESRTLYQDLLDIFSML
jgi:hypothetical protein